jgi:hypothetical protein
VHVRNAHVERQAEMQKGAADSVQRHLFLSCVVSLSSSFHFSPERLVVSYPPNLHQPQPSAHLFLSLSLFCPHLRHHERRRPRARRLP